MTANIDFVNVSKKYRLGMTRVSIPALASEWVKTRLGRSKNDNGRSREHWAVRDVSFSLGQGDSLALIGSNGAGKTTILKLLARITRPTSGTIAVNGKLSALIELGAGFHPDLSGRENIFLNGAILGLKKEEIKKRFDSIVSFAELEQFIDTPVKRYSSGMAVRLGFAVAASIDPDILLVDEVLAVGDTSFRLKCMKRIQELLDGGTILIFVSHNMGLVKAVCKKGLYIEKGQAQCMGDTNSVIDVYNQALNAKRMSEIGGARDEEQKEAGIIDITGTEVIDQRTGARNQLNTKQPARFVIQYHSYQDIDDVSFVVRIIRSDGVFCSVMYSNLDGASLSLRQGYGTVALILDPLQLFPGNYYAVVTLKNKHETITFDKVYTDWFQVETDTTSRLDLDAVYEPNRIWTHNHMEKRVRIGENSTDRVIDQHHSLGNMR